MENNQSTSTNTLKVVGLKKQFKKRVVVKNVSFEVNNHEVIGLLGPNGAGKTTSFYMVAGLLATDGGDIFLDGKNIKNTPIHERSKLGLGYLPQEASIFRNMTVEENVKAILEIRLKDKKEIASELDRLLNALSISHLRDSSAMWWRAP